MPQAPANGSTADSSAAAPALPDGTTPAEGTEPPALPDGTAPAEGTEPPALPDGKAPAEGTEPPAQPGTDDAQAQTDSTQDTALSAEEQLLQELLDNGVITQEVYELLLKTLTPAEAETSAT